MELNEKIKQIGYMPTTIEEEKINMIADAYYLTRVNVLRNLIHSHLTMDELYQCAKDLRARRDVEDGLDMDDMVVGDTVII